MLKVVGYDSLDALAKDNVPKPIQNFNFLQIGPPRFFFFLFQNDLQLTLPKRREGTVR